MSELLLSVVFVVLAVILFVRGDLLGLFVLVLATMSGVPGALRIYVFLKFRAGVEASDEPMKEL